RRPRRTARRRRDGPAAVLVAAPLRPGAETLPMRAPPRVLRGGGGERLRRSAPLAGLAVALASACAAPPAAAPAPDRVGAAAAFARARVAWTDGARELALAWYACAAELDPGSAVLRAELGHALLVTGDFARARDELAQARRLDATGCAGAVDLA